MNYGDFYRSFDPVPFYEERGWLIGDGRIGGKSKGLSFAHHILEKNGLLEDAYPMPMEDTEQDELLVADGENRMPPRRGRKAQTKG